jgi:hypothetical protein
MSKCIRQYTVSILNFNNTLILSQILYTHYWDITFLLYYNAHWSSNENINVWYISSIGKKR